jgi:type I restriction enzyme M protein
MVREALRERFLGALREMGGSAGNQRLRQELDWQEETYWQVHAAVIEEGAIIPGRGRGGSVSLAGGTKPHASRAPADRKRLAAQPSERREPRTTRRGLLGSAGAAALGLAARKAARDLPG